MESAYLLISALVMEFIDSALGMMYGTVLSPLLIISGVFLSMFLLPKVLNTHSGALIMQCRTLPVHESAVVIKGQAIIITGFSGAGKSTLLAAFRDSGEKPGFS